MLEEKVLLGQSLYHTSNMLTDECIGIIAQLCENISDSQVIKYYFRKAGKENVTRRKKYSFTNMTSELKSAFSSEYNYLLIVNSELEIVIELYDHWDNKEPLTIDIYSQHAYIFMYFACRLNALYGFLVSDTNSEILQVEVEAVPGKMWDDYSIETQKWADELKFYQTCDRKYDKYIRKAFWGNLLNKTHIMALGGVENIKKNAPAFLIKDMPNEGLYLQLTESPDDFYDPGYKEKLRILDKYLTPIILPGRPEVLWNYYDNCPLFKK